MKNSVLIIFAALGLGATGCGRGDHKPEAAEPKVAGDTVTIPTNAPQCGALTIEPVSSPLALALRLTGRLVWDEGATARVFSPFAGIVRKVTMEVNQPVARGQSLAEIQSADFGQAQADWRKAQSDFRRTERNLARAQELFEHGAAPRKDLELAEADYAGSQAEKERAEQRLAIYGALTLSTNCDFVLPSPLEGVLVERNVTPGQEVRPDQMLANMPQITAPLFVITDPTRLWAVIDASEEDLPQLQPGQRFTFTTRAFPNQTFTGTVSVVSQYIDPATRTVKVRGTVENPDRQLRAEMFVNLALPEQRQAYAASVPQKAVFLRGDKHYVFVEEQPGQFARHEVKVGPEQQGQIAIVAGLDAGQRVVTEGCVLLQQILQ
jgi:cobalt-zinc-cadmium efflux system membrane fusion protein